MIDLKQAVQKSFDYFNLFYKGVCSYTPFLEEAEFNGTSWFITLSFVDPYGEDLRYKIFKIRGGNGKLEDMKSGPLSIDEFLRMGMPLF